jgi:cell division septum initiation protein DivIVA
MDILHLVDRLEELFNESRAFPFTHSVIVNEDRMLDIIDQMRVSIPEEIKKAQQVLAQRDRVMAQAQEEANRTIALAREKGEHLVDQNNLVQASQSRADQIIELSRLESERIRRDADDYALESLSRLEAEMERILSQVRNGVRTLQAERQQPAQTTKPPTA